ncbi:uncharacterized protein LOC111990605 [Quercus suber]|uniref:uncharacterized protein LOC111990605 n=1 Tax=Quercus suber TaxID=58331 RepID=UPI000CE1F78C|nr:uncharacterized protein LOC111990605 [Quercus suber]
MIDTQTQSTQVPSPSSSKTLSINLKRKIPRPSFDLFAKRLRKAVTAIEPVYFDPSTATLILRSSRGGGLYHAPNLTLRILGWNCRGICNVVTIRALGAQIKGARLDVVFLSKTKADKNRMDYVKKFVKFDYSCVVEAKGYAGGLYSMWKNGLAKKEVEYDKNLIAVKGLWACIGAFNFIINDEEQFGGKKGGPSSTNYLKELLFELNAVDLGYSGNKFTWARGSKFIKLYKKQAATRDALRKWNKEVFGQCQDKINSLLKKIREVQDRQPSHENGLVENGLQYELSEWLLRSEVLWRQKSRELWLKLGDKNSNFFHLSTIIRRRSNNIDAIKNEDGSWIYEFSQIRNQFRDNFINLFKEDDICFPENLDYLVLPCITEEENESLQSISSPEEIKVALFQMQDLKALGLDGFPALFYKQLWSTVGNDVVKAVSSFFIRGSMPKEVNSSLIVLIPKISNPTTVNHYRPISLCNVVYKIISKLLVEKLRPLLDKLVLLTQSAFIPKIRWIAEN